MRSTKTFCPKSSLGAVDKGHAASRDSALDPAASILPPILRTSQALTRAAGPLLADDHWDGRVSGYLRGYEGVAMESFNWAANATADSAWVEELYVLAIQASLTSELQVRSDPSSWKG